MRPLVTFEMGDFFAEQTDRTGIGCQIVGDQVEKRRLAGAVGADDQPALALRNFERDAVYRRQAAEYLAQAADLQRSRHVLRSRADQRRIPGTTPSGMKITITTNTAPSSMFQRSRYADT